MIIDIDPNLLKNVTRVEEVIFRTGKAQRACRRFIEVLKVDGSVGQCRMARFVEGLEAEGTYSEEGFYTHILKRLRSLGLIELTLLRTGEKRYYPRSQPTTKKPPTPQGCLPEIIWQLCKMWNSEFWSPEEP